MADETITQDELADYLESVNGQRRDRALDLAAGALEYARRNREPEYEPGAVYRDPEGRLYLRTAAAGWLWLDPVDTAEPRPDDWVERPLRKLVPEGSPLSDSERDLIRGDLGRLLDLLGLGDFARPQSSHEVFGMCLEEVAKLVDDRKADHA